MEGEYDQDATSLDDSTVYQDGSQDADSSPDETGNPEDDQGSAPAAADAALSATAVDPAATPTDAVIPAPELRYANAEDFFSKDERDKLAGWLSEEAIDILAGAQKRHVDQRVATALAVHDQQSEFARDMNIPQQYAPHVRAAMAEVPDAIVEPKARVEAAMFIAMHKLAQMPGGPSVREQMKAYVNGWEPPAQVAATPAPRKPASAPAALPPSAVTTRSSVTGATVRNGATRSTDPLDKLFPFAAGS